MVAEWDEMMWHTCLAMIPTASSSMPKGCSDFHVPYSWGFIVFLIVGPKQTVVQVRSEVPDVCFLQDQARVFGQGHPPLLALLPVAHYP
jgi:hypothetical protein